MALIILCLFSGGCRNYHYDYSHDSGISWLLVYKVMAIIAGEAIIGGVCYSIVKSKGYDTEENNGFWWGFFLSWIGIIVCCAKPSVLVARTGGRKRQYSSKQNTNDTITWKCICGERNPMNIDLCRSCGQPRKYQSIQIKEKKEEILDCGPMQTQLNEAILLRKQGYITEEEFVQMRKNILKLN